MHQAKPLKLVFADDQRFSCLCLLVGGEYDSKVVLVSSVITPNYEETAIFLCEDWSGEEANWDRLLTKIYYVDTEDALNKIGYTLKVPLDTEIP